MQRQTGSLANPFLCPEFAVAVGKFRSDARVAVLTDGPDIAGFFPFQRRRLGVGAPISAGVTDYQGLIHAPGAEWDARELLRACQLSVWRFDCLAEGQLPFQRYAAAVAPSPVIGLTDGFVAYQEKLRVKSSKFCKDLARRTRKLEREAGELSFVADSRDPTELRTLMAWKSDQYRRTGWINVFNGHGSLISSIICSAPIVTTSAACSPSCTRAEPRSPRTSASAPAPCWHTATPHMTGGSGNSPLD